jgi:hypothetical protein
VIKYTRTIRALLYHAAVALLATGCTQSLQLRQPLGPDDLRMLNAAVRDRDVDMAYLPSNIVDYTHVDVENVRIGPERVQFVMDDREREITTRSLHQLTYLSADRPRLHGALDGLLIGTGFVALGAGVGGFVAANCSAQSSCTGEALAPALIGAAVGLVAAPLLGALIGRHDEVTIRAQ